MRFRLSLLLVLFPFVLYSQQVIFCESVEKGVPIKASKEFTIGSDGGFVNILVKLKKEIGSENVVFDVYRLTDNKEVFDNTIRMNVQPALTWFYKEITFFKDGEYRVYIFDDRDKLLGIGEVKINLR